MKKSVILSILLTLSTLFGLSKFATAALWDRVEGDYV